MSVLNHNDNRAVVTSAWRERVQKAEEDYLVAAGSATSQQLQQKMAGSGERRGYPSARVVAAAPARRGGNAKRDGAGGRSGRGHRGDSTRLESDLGADMDAVACIGAVDVPRSGR